VQPGNTNPDRGEPYRKGQEPNWQKIFYPGPYGGERTPPSLSELARASFPLKGRAHDAPQFVSFLADLEEALQRHLPGQVVYVRHGPAAMSIEEKEVISFQARWRRPDGRELGVLIPMESLARDKSMPPPREPELLRCEDFNTVYESGTVNIQFTGAGLAHAMEHFTESLTSEGVNRYSVIRENCNLGLLYELYLDLKDPALIDEVRQNNLPRILRASVEPAEPRTPWPTAYRVTVDALTMLVPGNEETVRFTFKFSLQSPESYLRMDRFEKRPLGTLKDLGLDHGT